jgi:hypothetical protein
MKPQMDADEKFPARLGRAKKVICVHPFRSAFIRVSLSSLRLCASAVNS